MWTMSFHIGAVAVVVKVALVAPVGLALVAVVVAVASVVAGVSRRVGESDCASAQAIQMRVWPHAGLYEAVF
jgi:hypothetical protein